MQRLLVSFFIYANKQETDGKGYTCILVLIALFFFNFLQNKFISLANIQAID